MKKVLYINLKFNNDGQRRMDENIIRELTKIAEVYVVCPKGWYEHTINAARYIYFETRSKLKNHLLNEYDRNLQLIFFANKLRKKRHFDYYLFASYDTVIFPMWRLVAPSTLSISYIIQNNNIDGVVNSKKKLKRWLFNMYSKKVNHIVLERFIGDFIVKEFGIPSEQVFLLPHPLNSNKYLSDKVYDCVGISNSNDDEWIDKIIRKETEQGIFKSNECKVVLRSKKYSYNNGWLKVINGWMDDNDYNTYINQAKCIFLPYPKSFKYRMSGSVVDAFSNHTSVIGSAIPLFLYYSKVYVNICKIVESPEELFQVITGDCKVETDNDFFQRFIELHSDEVVFQSLKKIIRE